MRTSDLIVLGFIAIIIVAMLIANTPSTDTSEQIKKFSSHAELNSFVKANTEQYYGGIQAFGAPLAQRAADVAEGVQAPSAQQKSVDYSTTNIQVAGVDEADIVKSDGKYLYIVSGQSLVIVDAYPPEGAKIVSKIELNRTPHEIFINDDKLVVFGYDFNQYEIQPLPLIGAEPSVEKIASPLIYPYYSSKTFIHVYDVSDRANPILKRNLSIDGDYFDSRMIDDHVYAVINQPFSLRDDIVPLPRIYYAEKQEEIAVTDVYYFDVPDNSYRFVTILSLNTQNDNEDISKNVYMMGYSENLFVSQNNIYVTYMKQLPYTYYTERLVEQVLLPLLPSDVANEIRAVLQKDIPSYEKTREAETIFSEYFNTLNEDEKNNLMRNIETRTQKYYEDLAKETQKTVIHKIAISNGKVEYKAQGEVPGSVLNQFSMDEYNGNFRIATTITSDFRSGATLNNVYVLDENLNIVGRLENLARTERIYSARFINDRLYLVTFRQIDPLFVIDLSDPTNPRVLGELKIPGVSQYLHPYDENHIIGIGKDAIAIDEQGREFALFQGVKISLFDVSDVANPKEKSSYVIGDRGTDSEVLQDHKAFLFSKERNLLVLPITLAEIDKTKPQDPRWAYGEYKLSGAYVFELTLDKGFVLKGVVKHHERTEQDLYYYGTVVRRSMYIDNVLYTLSNTILRMNSLDNLEEMNEIELPYLKYDYVIQPIGRETVVGVGVSAPGTE